MSRRQQEDVAEQLLFAHELFARQRSAAFVIRAIKERFRDGSTKKPGMGRTGKAASPIRGTGTTEPKARNRRHAGAGHRHRASPPRPA